MTRGRAGECRYRVSRRRRKVRTTKSDPSALDAVVTVKPLGDMPGIRALGQTCVSHGMTHAGEIELVRTLIGVAPVAGV